MRVSTFIVVVLLTVIAIALLTAKRNGPVALSLPALPQQPTEVSTPTPTPRAAPQTPTPAPLPVPTVHVTNLTVVRGMVIDVVAGRAVVDCNHVARLSPQSEASWHNAAVAGGGGARFAEMAIKQAERETFGSLKMMDAKGTLRDADFQPPQRVKGQAILGGMPVQKGAMVHVVVAPLTMQGTQEVIYTARFQTTGGTWMWKNKSNPLEQPAKSGS